MGEVASIYTTAAEGLIDCAIKTEGLGTIPVTGKIQHLGIFIPWVEAQELKTSCQSSATPPPKISTAGGQHQSHIPTGVLSQHC